MDMKEITLVARDRIGLLADISEALAAAGVNIESVSVETAARSAVVRLLVKDAAMARATLSGKGFKVAADDAILVKLPDRPGELARITRRLAQDGISISNVLMVGRENGETLLAITSSDAAKARLVLSK
ncbi:MAG: ACT domain-containing protein [Candidatus Micrarchaeota archaeon]